MGSGHRAAWAEGPKQGLGDTVVTVLEECVCVSTYPHYANVGCYFKTIFIFIYNFVELTVEFLKKQRVKSIR